MVFSQKFNLHPSALWQGRKIGGKPSETNFLLPMKEDQKPYTLAACCRRGTGREREPRRKAANRIWAAVGRFGGY